MSKKFVEISRKFLEISRNFLEISKPPAHAADPGVYTVGCNGCLSASLKNTGIQFTKLKRGVRYEFVE